MKKLLATLLASAMLLSCFFVISFAEEATIQGDPLVGVTYPDPNDTTSLFRSMSFDIKYLQTFGTIGANAYTYARHGLQNYNTTDHANKKNAGLMVRYDLSKVPANAERIKVSVAISKHTNSEMYNRAVSTNIVMGVFGVEGLNDSWNYDLPAETKKEALFEESVLSEYNTNNLLRDYVLSNRLGETSTTDPDCYDEPTTSGANLPINGRRFFVDVTEYAKKKIASDEKTMDIYFLPESYGTDPNATDCLTFYLESVRYQHGSYKECYYFRPSVFWCEAANKDTDNTLSAVTVENGTLTEEFDGDATDADDETRKTYRIGVTEEGATVSLSYELNSSFAKIGEGAKLSGVAGETLVIPVVSESGVTKTYYFELFNATGVPTIEHVFRGIYDTEDGDGDFYTFVFGKTNLVGNEVSDISLDVYDKNAECINVSFSQYGKAGGITGVNQKGIFGFAIKDNGNKLGDLFTVKPSCVINGEKIYGNSYGIDKRAVTLTEAAPGSKIATDDILVFRRNAFSGFYGRAENVNITDFSAGVTANGPKHLMIKYDISEAKNASRVYASFVTRASANSSAYDDFNPDGTSDVKVKIYGVDGAKDSWTDDLIGAEGWDATNKCMPYYFSTMMNCEKTYDAMNGKFEEIFANPIAEVSKENATNQTTKSRRITFDVTKYVKKCANMGKSTITLLIDGTTTTSGTLLYAATEYPDNGQVPMLNWE